MVPQHGAGEVRQAMLREFGAKGFDAFDQARAVLPMLEACLQQRLTCLLRVKPKVLVLIQPHRSVSDLGRVIGNDAGSRQPAAHGFRTHRRRD